MSKQTIEEMALDLNAKFQFLIDSQAETLEKLSALPVWVFSVQNHHNQEMDFFLLLDLEMLSLCANQLPNYKSVHLCVQPKTAQHLSLLCIKHIPRML